MRSKMYAYSKPAPQKKYMHTYTLYDDNRQGADWAYDYMTFVRIFMLGTSAICCIILMAILT